jgi:hypothetical protein
MAESLPEEIAETQHMVAAVGARGYAGLEQGTVPRAHDDGAARHPGEVPA